MSARPLRQPSQIHVRCDAGQLLAWRLAAKRAGLDLSAWARQVMDRAARRRPA